MGGAPGREQAQHAALGGLDQGEHLIQGGLGDAGAGAGQVGGHVEDALAGVVEGGADVEASPGLLGQGQSQGAGHGVEAVPQGEGRRRHDAGAAVQQMARHRSGDLDGGQEEARGLGAHAGTLDPGHIASLGHRVRGHAVQGVDQVRDSGAGDRQAPGGLAGAVAAQGAGLVAHVGGDLAGGAVQEHERVVQGGGQGRLQAAVGQLGQRELEGLARGLQLADQHGGVLAGGGGGARHGGRRQGDGALGADAVGQLVGLVDDEDLVVGQDPGVAGHDHAEHGVVGHHEIGPGGDGARQLGEALGLQGAGLSQALGPGDGDLGPGALGDARDEVVAVTGVRLGGPLAQADHLLAQARVAPVPGGRLGDGVPDAEEGGLVLLLRVPAVQAVAAQVVLPALEQGHLGAGAGDLLDGVGGQGRVLGEDLPLQGQGGGGDHDPGTGLHGVDHGGHQVAQ